MITIGTPLLWSLFGLFVVAALLVDFLAMNRQGAHTVSMKEAAIWSIIWVAVSIVFGAWLWWYLGGTSDDAAARAFANDKALEYGTGYLIEKALAVDNIFVFLMLFTYFAVPVFAILGLRAMYFLLADMHDRFHLLSYGLALVLVMIGAKMLLVDIYHVPVTWSLVGTAVIITASIILSRILPARGKSRSAYPFRSKDRGRQRTERETAA